MSVVVANARRAVGESSPVNVTVDATRTGPAISPFIYGQFIEHLGRCIYGGIWAEMLEDRKFYFPITDEYAPYGDLKDTKFPIVSASPWEVVGPKGSVTMVKEGALVGEHSPQIAAGSGIRQKDLSFIAGKAYVLYAWLKPHGKPKVEIRVGTPEDEFAISVDPLESSNGEFVRIPFEFTATNSTDKGTFTVEIENASCLVGAVSLMPADNVRGFRADTLALLKQLHGTVYRWPGGNFVSGYNWRDGIGPRDRRPPRRNPAWTGVEHNDVGIDEFLDLCHEIDAEPMIAVNTGFGDENSAVEEVEYANKAADTIGGALRAKNGHEKPYGVKYWCVGNEMWGDWQLGHMRLEHYTIKHNRVADAMRKVDPTMKLVASGDIGTKAKLGEGDKSHDVGWSEGMLEKCGDRMDYISEHFYRGRLPWTKDGVIPTEEHANQLREEIRKKAVGHRELQAKLGRKPEDFIPIAMDEWNYWHRDYLYGEIGCQYDLADALGVAAGLHEYFRNGDIIQMAHYAQTVNVIGCIKTTKTAAFFDTTALPLLLYRREFGSTPLAVKADIDEKKLDVAAAKTKDGKAVTIGIVNPQQEAQPIKIAFDGAAVDPHATGWRITADKADAVNVAEKQAVAIAGLKDVTIGDTIEAPPLSVTVIRAALK
ncbi:MAG: alpha-L-arabinofuranosidase C-terminal domain-containing protein [Pirellulales bacterium]